MKFSKILIIVMVWLGLSGGFLPEIAFSKDIRWQSFADGMARGKSENKKVFLHFYAEWCAACKTMEDRTFKDPGVIASLNKDFVPVKVDIDRNKKISEMFKIKVLPDTWFIAENAKILGHRPGYISPVQLKTLLKMLINQDPGQ
jgi:thioredoxin-like negative regulator of GroEL